MKWSCVSIAGTFLSIKLAEYLHASSSIFAFRQVTLEYVNTEFKINLLLEPLRPELEVELEVELLRGFYLLKISQFLNSCSLHEPPTLLQLFAVLNLVSLENFISCTWIYSETSSPQRRQTRQANWHTLLTSNERFSGKQGLGQRSVHDWQRTV